MNSRFHALVSGLLLTGTLPADTLSPLAVTATRTAISVNDSLAAVRVIDRQEIERSQARSVAELLSLSPGVRVSSNGGLGKAASVFLRGTESDHLLVLVDGIRIGSATTGAAALHDLSPGMVDRIEVVRGPRSSLYGAEAVGGVIQIFTRRDDSVAKATGHVAFGSHNTSELSTGFSGGAGGIGFSAQVEARNTRGINACEGSYVGGCFTYEPDLDAYESVAGHFRLHWSAREDTELDLHWLRTDAESDFDGFFQNRENTMQQLLGVTLYHALGDQLDLTLSGGRSRDESDNYLISASDGGGQGRFSSQFLTVRDHLSLQADWQPESAYLLTLGFDGVQEKVGGTTDYHVASRDNLALFGQSQFSFGGQDVNLALRLDDNEQFGQEVTGSLAWGRTLSSGLRMTASWGNAFKAPSFNELYFPGFGNPELTPETSQSLEFSFRGNRPSGMHWAAYIYETRIEDLISFDAARFLPDNIDRARIRGLELEAGYSAEELDLQMSASWLDAEHRGSGELYGKRLPRRPDWNLRLDLDRGYGDWSIGGTMRFSGKAYDDLANTLRLDSYILMDLRMEYRFSSALSLSAKLSNVAGVQYETAAFYNQPQRELLVTLRYSE
jgi:vitamin B12 transporter